MSRFHDRVVVVPFNYDYEFIVYGETINSIGPERVSALFASRGIPEDAQYEVRNPVLSYSPTVPRVYAKSRTIFI